MPKPLVIYHGDCADGFGAAWCFWKKYGDEYDYFKGQDRIVAPDCTDRHVYLVDFSYARETVEKMLSQAKSVTLIDHHKSAIEDLKGVFGLKQYIDLKRSGAGLAWDFLNPDTKRPTLINHIEDRDLWQFKLEGSKEIASYLFSFPYRIRTWDKLITLAEDPTWFKRMLREGKAILRKHMKDINELLVLARPMKIGDYVVPCINVPYTMGSDAAAELAKDQVFAAYYTDGPDSRNFGLRSAANEQQSLDVAEIAKLFGGGGHKNASGFKVPRDHELAKV